MKLIQQKVELWTPKNDGTIQDVYEQIEKAGRVCYKSEDKITDSSAEKFVNNLIKNKHGAMLEHGTVYLYLEVNYKNCTSHFDFPQANFTANYSWSDVVGHVRATFSSNPYSKVNTITTGTYNSPVYKTYITTNYRVIIENGLEHMLQFMSPKFPEHFSRYTVHFTTSIGIVRELLRHRKFSFANESTRYCNYSKDKFGNEITYIIPTEIGPTSINNGDVDYFPGDYFNRHLKWCEEAYFELLEKGWTPEQARDILPLATKSELVMTGFEEDWNHFFDLRLHGTTGKPHPDIKALAGELEIKFWVRHITNRSEAINELIE